VSFPTRFALQDRVRLRSPFFQATWRPVRSCLRCRDRVIPIPESPRWWRRTRLAYLLVVNGDPIADIALLEKPNTRLAMIMKGDRIYNGILEE
jgi:hypothetical protein